MLDHEENIKKDRDVRQQELDGVSRDAAPIVLETRVKKQLDQGEDTARYVQQDLTNMPPLSGFALIVDPSLRHILGDGDQ